MPVRLGLAALLLERPAERVVRVVVGRRELEHGAELGLGLVPAAQPEVGDPERLADRGLVGLEPLGLLERHGRLRGHALAQPLSALLEEVVGLASIPAAGTHAMADVGVRDRRFDLVEDRTTAIAAASGGLVSRTRRGSPTASR